MFVVSGQWRLPSVTMKRSTNVDIYKKNTGLLMPVQVDKHSSIFFKSNKEKCNIDFCATFKKIK